MIGEPSLDFKIVDTASIIRSTRRTCKNYGLYGEWSFDDDDAAVIQVGSMNQERVIAALFSEVPKKHREKNPALVKRIVRQIVLSSGVKDG